MRYRKKNEIQMDPDEALFEEALDETGTVSTAAFTDTDDSDSDAESTGRTAEYNTLTTEQQEARDIQGVSDELLRVHGIAPGKKADGVTRAIYENLNGLHTKINDNDKLTKAKELIDELEADIVAYNEHRINSSHKLNKNGLSQLFRGGEAEIRSVTGHNTHENVARFQEGGTSLMLFGPLIGQYDFEHSGKDETGLGRWVVMVLQGSDGIKTRIVCAYNACYNNKRGSKTAYQQQRRYFIRAEKDKTCPRRRFREDLEKQLKLWRKEGDRLIVCMDANEHVYKKSIGKALTCPDGLNMNEVVGKFTGQPLGATYFRGKNPIDAIWATPDIQVTGACVMPVGF